ncbi:hypothetical protein BGZ67_006102, partial [Mortierella alpina]
MRLILLPLMAASLLAFSVVVVAAESANQIPIVDPTHKKTENVRTRQPIGTIYAYWPNKKEGDPSTRIIEIASEDGLQIQPYRALYKDPHTNAYNLSDPVETYAGLSISSDQSKASQTYGIVNNHVDAQILFSVYLDAQDQPVYRLPGTEVPSSWRDMRTHHRVM